MIKGILLDVDGTLVASNDAHTHAWVDAFKEHGREVEFEKVKPLMGMGGDKLIPTLFPDLNSDEGLGKEISESRKKFFKEKYIKGLKPTRGARELVSSLKTLGVRLVIASSAQEDELELLLKIAQMNNLIHRQTTSSDVEQSKPAPDIVAVALKKIELSADEVVMLGDTPYDIEAANQCGVKVIALRSGGFADSTLKGAIAIFDDPMDLLENYARSNMINGYIKEFKYSVGL